MANKTDKLKLIIEAQDKFSGTMGKLDSKMKRFATSAKTSFKSIASSVFSLKTAIVGMVAALSVKSFLKASERQELAMQRIVIAAQKQGVAINTLRQDMLALTAAAQKTTIYGDEEQLEAMAFMMTMGVSYQKTLKTLPVLLDMASASNMNLNQAARALARGLEGDIQSLQRYAPWITKLSKENRNAEYVIDRMTRTLGGHAENLAQTFAGQIIQFNNMVSDLAEKIGFFIARAIVPFLTKAKQISGVFENVGKMLAKVAFGYEVLTDKATEGNKELKNTDDILKAMEDNLIKNQKRWKLLATIISTGVSVIKRIVISIKTLIAMLKDAWLSIKAVTQSIWLVAITFATSIITVVNGVQVAVKTMANIAIKAAKTVLAPIMRVQAMLAKVTFQFDKVKMFNDMADKLEDKDSFILDTSGNVSNIKKAAKAINEQINNTSDSFKELGDNTKDSITEITRLSDEFDNLNKSVKKDILGAMAEDAAKAKKEIEDLKIMDMLKNAKWIEEKGHKGFFANLLDTAKKVEKELMNADIARTVNIKNEDLSNVNLNDIFTKEYEYMKYMEAEENKIMDKKTEKAQEALDKRHKQIQDAFDKEMQLVNAFANQMRGIISNSLTDAIYDGITNGFKNAADIVKSFAQTVLKAFIQKGATSFVDNIAMFGDNVEYVSRQESLASQKNKLSGMKTLTQSSNMRGGINIYNVSSPSEVPPNADAIVNIIGSKLSTDSNFRNGLKAAVQ